MGGILELLFAERKGEGVEVKFLVAATKVSLPGEARWQAALKVRREREDETCVGLVEISDALMGLARTMTIK